MLDYVNHFCVMQRMDLPSDHAPIMVSFATKGEDLDGILSRAGMLGDHSALCTVKSSCTHARKPIKTSRIIESASAVSVVNDTGDVNTFSQGVSDALYECARRSVAPIRIREPTDNTLNRWESLLQDNDDMRVWKAIDWSGNVSTGGNTDHECRSDEAFKTHFEMIFNPPGVKEPTTDDISTDPR